ncbi:MAG: hypothetical protein ACRYE7_00205, partial [Janthinobacterium lividum]
MLKEAKLNIKSLKFKKSKCIISERNKRCVRVPQMFLNFDNSGANAVENDLNKTGVLYKYYEGYLLFELDEIGKPYKIWRDCPSGNYPLVTIYTPLCMFTEKIINSNIQVIYTNDAKPLSRLFDTNRNDDNPIVIIPFFVPIEELFNTIVKEQQRTTGTPNAMVKSADANVVLTPTYDEIKKLDPTISHRDFLHIYRL